MISRFGFYWSKILPISYDNYLSETEILEALRRKLAELIESVNTLGSDFENIGNLIDEYYIKNVLPKLQSDLSDLENKINLLSENTDNRLENLKIYIDTMDNHILEQLTVFEEKHDNDVKSLENQIEALNARYNFLKEYVDKQDGLILLKVSRLMRGLYKNTVTYIRTYFNELSNKTITVISPLTAKRVTLQYALEELLQWQSTGLTAYEYRMLDLTATEYRALNLTAEQYRLYGIRGEYIEPVTKMYDLWGRDVEQPLSSVYAIFGEGITADMGNLDITCEQYRTLSNVYGASELDRYGAYILTGQYKSVFKDTVKVVTDTITITNGVHNLSLELKPLEVDTTVVSYVSLFNDESANKLQANLSFDYVIENSEVGSISYIIKGATFNAVTKKLYLDVTIFHNLLDNGSSVSIKVFGQGITTTKSF